MARSPDAVGSVDTVHCAGPPWPVRANSKPAGAAPAIIFSMGIMMAPAWDWAAGPAHAIAPAKAAGAKMRLIDSDVESLLPFICTLPMQRCCRCPASLPLLYRGAFDIGGSNADGRPDIVEWDILET